MRIYATRYGQRITEKETCDTYYNYPQEKADLIKYVKNQMKKGAIVKTKMRVSHSPYIQSSCGFYIYPTQEDYEREVSWHLHIGVKMDWE